MIAATFFALTSCIICNAYPSLLFSTAKDIRFANVSRPSKYVAIIKDLDQGNALDYYSEGRTVCWSDLKLGIIQCATYNGTHVGSKVTVVPHGQSLADGIAIDWYTQKLYWTDGDAHRIEVVSLDGKYWRKVLFWGEDIDQPRAIALVPSDSIMFWTDWGEVPKIERADMDGDQSSRRVLVSKDIFWPNGLTVDYDTNKIYWLDARLRFIDEMDFEGRNRKRVTHKGVLYPFALTFSRGKLFWTDWETWSIHTLDLVAGTEARELLHSQDGVPNGLQVMDPLRQTYRQSPCRSNNGGCSHLCLLSSRAPGYLCACPTGVKLIDNYTCANGPQEMILLVQMTEICLISLDSPDYTSVTLNLHGIKHAMGIDYNYNTGWIYWTDDMVRVIRRARLDGSGQEDVVTSELEQPDGIAIDWRANNVYWTDTGTDRIQVLRINTTYTKVLINTDLWEPRAIAVSPDDGIMFWSDWNDKKPKIEKAALDGSMRSVLVNERLGWPNGLTVDLPRRKLFWCDAKTDAIEVINFDGTERKEVVTENLSHAFGITVIGDYLYWTDWQRRSLESAHKIKGTSRRVILDQLANIMSLKAIKPNWIPPPSLNPCSKNNGNCAHLCLNTPIKYVCACHIGYELQTDQRSCSIPDAFLMYTRKDIIGRMSIENTLNDETVPISGIKEASALNFDYKEKRIYWTDVKAKTISRAFFNGSRVEKIVEFGLESPEGLAVDWVAGNIYWTDSGSRRIEVARVDGKYRRAIIWTRLHDPRSITVDPIQEYIYWVEGRVEGGSPGSIHRAHLDGSAHKTLINNVGRANSLTIDVEDKKLYWCALQGHIEAANTDGTKRTIVVSSPRPYSLSIYQDKIYWSDWQTGDIYMVNKHTRENRTHLHSDVEQVSSVVIHHGGGQKGWGICQDGGGCSQLCVGHCACQTHYTLQDRKCIPPSSYMIVTTKNSASRLLIDPSEAPDVVLPLSGLKNIRAIDYDPVKATLYSIDSKTGNIKTWPEQAAPRVVVDGGQHPAWLAVDPFSRVLFYSSATDGTINATKMDNESSPVVVVRSHGAEKPRQLALHPTKGLLFWVSEGLSESRIYRCRMDGVRRTTVVSSLAQVTAFSLDPKADFIYWATATSVETADIHGKNRKELVVGIGNKVNGLAVFGKYLYWLHTQSVVQYDKVLSTTKNVYYSHHSLTALVAVYTPTKKGDMMWECLSGEKVASHMDCPREGPCSPDQFACARPPGDCIPLKWRCDSTVDCPDASDETGCPLCDSDKFTCQPGLCIDLKYVCDGIPHCSDNSDERSCCGGHACGSKCLPLSSLCNGWAECHDASDEAACQVQPPTTSHPHLLLLALVLATCILVGLYSLCRWKKSRVKPGGVGAAICDPALDPLAPKPLGRPKHSVRMSSLQRSSSSQPSTGSLLYPLNPPPSPATTSKECSLLYRPPPPTPCSTDVCHETDSNYQGDSEPLPPPPTPTSLSPSSSTYFPPPPSPTP